MKAPTLSYLADIHFGAGSISLVPELLRDLGIERPMVVTDRGVLGLGIVARAGLEGAVTWASVESNPSERSVTAGVDMYRESRCDGLIAIGGGSPIDCAKGIGLLASHPGPLAAYGFLAGGLAKITRTLPALIAVPTTAGTGSEVGRAALITLEGGTKTAFLSPHFIPKTVVCDPAVTLGTPRALSAGAGMDAISHCVETYCSPRFNPVADAIALDGLARACANLPRVVKEGADLAARGEMMMGALQGGLCFQKGLGLVHSLSHPLGGLPGKRLHHGTLNAIFLPHVLRYNLEACPERMDRMAAVLARAHRSDLPRYFQEMTAGIGLPGTLTDAGVLPGDLAGLEVLAHRDHCSATNPRPVTEEVCRELYRAAL